MAYTPNHTKSKPIIIFMISDQSADLTYLYERFGIQISEEESTSLRFQIFSLAPNLGLCELYIFPKNRQLKSYCQLYCSLLGKPDIVLYAVDTQASIKQSIEWLNLFQKDIQTKIVFFSSAKTYLDRQQILSKICTLFLKNITNQVFFPFLDNSSFENCILNIKTVGVSMQSYARTIPAVSKIKWFWRRIKNWRKSQQTASVI